jgi:hypothetical protein
MTSMLYFALMATHERFSGIESEKGLPGVRTFHPPEVVGTTYVVREVTENYDGVALQDSAYEILGMIIGGIRPVPHEGKPCLKVMTLEKASATLRDRVRQRVAQLRGLGIDELSFYGGQSLSQNVEIEI